MTKAKQKADETKTPGARKWQAMRLSADVFDRLEAEARKERKRTGGTTTPREIAEAKLREAFGMVVPT